MHEPAIYLLATLDTKGLEAAYLRERLTTLGMAVRVVDVGCLGQPSIVANISREQVFQVAGESLATLQERSDRGHAVTTAAIGATRLVLEHHGLGKVAGVIALGGSAGTTIGSAAMRALPVGLPKVMVTTQASGNVRGYVGHKDIVMINPIVDIAGLNRITRTILAQAAAAIAGMVRFAAPAKDASDRPIVAASMFGVTTPCVERARAVLEAAGYEVLVFHATGSGGEAMESLIRDGLVAGVLDVTTTELADELCGGFLSAGPERLTAAGATGIPQVISVGATDMVNFYGIETVPERFRERLLYRHNAHVTLMRTTVEENQRIGAELARKASAARGPVSIMLPRLGVSALDRAGQPFDDPAAREALFLAVREGRGEAELIEMDYHINDPPFAEALARRLIERLQTSAAIREPAR